MGMKCDGCGETFMPQVDLETRHYCPRCAQALNGVTLAVPSPMAAISQVAKDLPPARVVRLRAGDVVVVETPEPLSDAQMKESLAGLGKMFPKNEVVVLTAGSTFRVVSPEEGRDDG